MQKASCADVQFSALSGFVIFVSQVGNRFPIGQQIVSHLGNVSQLGNISHLGKCTELLVGVLYKPPTASGFLELSLAIKGTNTPLLCASVFSVLFVL